MALHPEYQKLQFFIDIYQWFTNVDFTTPVP